MYSNDDLWDVAELKKQIDKEEKRDVYKSIGPEHAGSLYGGVNRAIGIGFSMPSDIKSDIASL